MIRAVVRPKSTFIDVITRGAVTGITNIATALVGSLSIVACGMSVAIRRTFVYIGARGTRTRISCIAGTSKGPDGIRACGIGMAIVQVVNALVDVVTVHPVAGETSIAVAKERASEVLARCLGIAVVHIRGTFIDINAAPPSARVSGIAVTNEGSNCV